MSNGLRTVQPDGWDRPRGYANGMAGRGEVLLIAGQIGCDGHMEIVSDNFIKQFDQALANVMAVLEKAGGKAENLAKMTVYVTDLDAYRSAVREIGDVWRARLGKHFPAMALIGISGLVDPRAKVEIEATAILGDR